MKRAEHINLVASILGVLFLSTSVLSLFIVIDNSRQGKRSYLLSSKSEGPNQLENYLLYTEKEVEGNEKPDENLRQNRLDQNCVPLAFCLIGGPLPFNPFAPRLERANHPFIPAQELTSFALYRVLII